MIQNANQLEKSGPAPAAGFFGSRTGWRELKEHVLLEPVLGGSRWAAAFGSLLLFNFILQVITGILLVTCYAPSVGTAWQSVKYIQTEAPLGWLVRGIHHWGSSTMVVLLLLHMTQVFIWGAYKRPRELTWMTGVLLLAATLGLAFTGYLLPWDERAYWASKVGIGIVSTIPLIGEKLRLLLQGGPDMGNLTLTRFFALHGFVLPGAIIGLVVVHLYLFRLHGVTTAWWRSKEDLLKDRQPFWPNQIFKDAIVALALLLILVGWTYSHPAPLGAMADPSKAYQARPEWYFMFLFRLLRFFHGPYEVLGTFVLPSLFFCILFFWPFLDRGTALDPRRRPKAMTIFGISVLSLVGLTIYAIATDVRMIEPAAAVASAPPRKAPAAPLQKLDVANLYTANCMACHAVDGTGNALRVAFPTIPNFTDPIWQKTRTDKDFILRIQDGKPPLMPAFKDKLSAEQIQALADYTRAFAVKQPAAH
ncbi:MAG TPA: cytochrome b N-terminal domain-containing protein [Tepidisphaeraceae bacterium]|nr:cytochrome b N-terminal domain-containing protein [Tepidisphaeraceae bacterium]